MRTQDSYFACPRARRHFIPAAALILFCTVALAAPAATASGDGAPAAPDARASETTAQAAIEEPSDRREILPDLTMDSHIRLQTESRRNTKFDRARPGNDDDKLFSRSGSA